MAEKRFLGYTPKFLVLKIEGPPSKALLMTRNQTGDLEEFEAFGHVE